MDTLPAFLYGADYLALPRDPQPWVIKDLLPAGGLTNIFGQPKTGKSFLMLGMAEAITQGKTDFLGFPVLKHGTVAVLQIDTPRADWAYRLTNAQAFGHDFSKVAFCDMLMAPYPFNILDPSNHQWLAAEIAALRPVVVFVDTLREAHGGDENDSTIMRNVISNIVDACHWVDDEGQKVNAAVAFISHARKDTEYTKNDPNDVISGGRGSSYVPGRMDTIVKVNAKSLEYTGRSVGKGRITIEQHEDSQMLQVDPEAKAYFELLERRVREMRADDPKVSVNAMATTLAGKQDPKTKEWVTLPETTYVAGRTINKHIKEFLAKHGSDKVLNPR